MTQYRWQFNHEGTVASFAQLQEVLLASRQTNLTDLQAKFEIESFQATDAGLDGGQVQTAVKRLMEARDTSQKILIFGDYDVDGNCATAIVWLGLAKAGFTQVRPFIPDRVKHGYGMSSLALQEIFADDKPDLIVTVDNGISARPALDYCREQGVEVIVTDHHQPDDQGPLPVVATLQTTQLCGAGVAWVLMYELFKAVNLENSQDCAQNLLDLVAVATIVDQVPLVGVNRRLVRAGMEQLNQTKRAGLLALMKAGGNKAGSISTHDIGFGLGPRINAIGRLTNTLDALRLLCTGSPAYAAKLAKTLNDVNRTRQELTRDMLELAESQIDPDELAPILIVAHPDFHEGIIGLIAGHLAERYYRPAIALAVGEQVAKASARSIPGFNVTDFIRQFEADLLSVGGHALAAGFSVAREKLDDLRERMVAAAGEKLAAADLVPTLQLEVAATPTALTDCRLPVFLEQLEPCGAGNPPVQVAVVGSVADVRLMGSEQQHAKVSVTDQLGWQQPCLFWQYALKGKLPSIGERVMIAGELQVSEWRSKKSTDLIATAWKKVDTLG